MSTTFKVMGLVFTVPLLGGLVVLFFHNSPVWTLFAWYFTVSLCFLWSWTVLEPEPPRPH